jgi:serine/threonine protein kinase/Tol biopolymer transport system component
MTPERWQELKELVASALPLPEPARASFVRGRAPQDPELCREALSLLSSTSRAEGFLSAPAIEAARSILDSVQQHNFTPISAGARFGPYEILGLIGAGGMGEVYRARDERLKRDVAIKVLPSLFTQDPDRLRRFEQEAHAAGGLNHPNILAIHDTGSRDGTPYVVSELLEGETLRSRLAMGALPARKAIDYAVQVARGLAAAHEKGIVHRDLKPENLFITKDGRVKILDFGLAKVTRPEDGLARASAAPTATAGTEPGVIMGTVGYMSPEQVRGQPADGRSDIFSFGAILYEMLSGKRAFHGNSAADTMSAILKEEPPDLSSTNRSVSPGLERIVRHCLEKIPEERFQSARDLAFDLEALSGLSGQSPAAGVSPGLHLLRLPAPALGAIALGLIAAGIGLGFLLRAGVGSLFPGSPSLPLVSRVALTVSSSDEVSLSDSPAISPDGRSIVYVAQRGKGNQQLFLHRLDAWAAAPVAGTEGASCPFFSPNGLWIGFMADGSIRKIPVGGGTPVTICSKPFAPRSSSLAGASWGTGDLIVFSELSTLAGGLMRVSASGGEPQPLTKGTTKPDDLGHFWPEILPDGKAAIFTVFTGKKGPDENDIAVVQLATGEKKILIKGGSYARYVATGHLVFARGGALLAIAFDPKRLEVKGAPFEVERGISHSRNGNAGFAVSRDGTLVSVDHIAQTRSLLWVDRKGNTNPMTSLKRAYFWPKFSPDGTRVAIGVEEDSGDVLVLDLARDSLTRVTFGGEDECPTWSPDGKRLVYASLRGDRVLKMFVRPSDGSGSDELLPCPPRSIPVSWSPDGRFLAFYSWNQRPLQIWLYPIGTGEPARPLIQNAFNNLMPRISPDGNWMAYMSNETGQDEVYVTSFPDAKGKWQVSQGKGGGHDPLWAHNGREIFYRQADKIMAVKVRTAPTFSEDRPELLFEHPYYDEWDVAADGRFAMVTDEKISPTHLNLLLNWSAGLKAPGAAAGKQ